MKILLIIVVFFLIIGVSGNSQSPDSVRFKSLEPYDFHLTYLKAGNSMLIDVREFFEYRRSRIKDAVNIPSSGNLEYSAETIDKNYALFLYCTTDYRSIRVARYFYDRGFTRVYSLKGGIVAWKKDGFPVERKRVKRR